MAFPLMNNDVNALVRMDSTRDGIMRMLATEVPRLAEKEFPAMKAAALASECRRASVNLDMEVDFEKGSVHARMTVLIPQMRKQNVESWKFEILGK